MPIHFKSHLIGWTICGDLHTYPRIHLSSLRIDYILYSNVHAPHILLHSYIVCSYLTYNYAFYFYDLRLIAHDHIKMISYTNNVIVKRHSFHGL